METNQFFYDSQVRRFIIQFIRLCSGYQVEFGSDYRTVPVMYGDPSRQVAHILRGNSENTMATVPAMAVYVNGLTYDRKRMQEPFFVDKRNIRMRKRDEVTGELTTQQGNAFTIERLMPVPYDLKLKLDIWTSNTSQKLQLIEQIAPLFNPSFEIQSSDNYFDWTSLTTVNLGDITWTSRSVPAMGSTDIDIATMTFNIPIWISPPSKVKKLGVIHRVVTSVYDIAGDLSVDATSGFDDNLLMGQRVRIGVTDYDVVLLNGELTLHRAAEFVNPDNEDIGVPVTVGSDEKLPWNLVFDKYAGQLCPGISKVALLLADELSEVTGTITIDEDDPNRMIFDLDIDSVPANDMDPVTAVIDPLRSGPGTGLDIATVGQRYLILDGIGDASDSGSAEAWRGTGGQELVASVNDVIEYDGTQWNVVFDASERIGEVHYMTNLTTQIQYSWVQSMWQKSYEGEYLSGWWNIIF